ncbi:hypothetical protein GCM10009680_44920 [Streptomyces yatensis]|uniref:Uncharacterized protein n=1 Tax=Streptomyces yatensis TaxID=155177 RepID=A0ABN2I7M3_9ACTN
MGSARQQLDGNGTGNAIHRDIREAKNVGQDSAADGMAVRRRRSTRLSGGVRGLKMRVRISR